jgi:hypothetical protein
MDLLTVLMHELGHLLGHGHEAEGVMREALAAGVRETPEALPADLAFAHGSVAPAWLDLGERLKRRLR